jgi:other hect domain ubiquitin protein ligase E3
MGMLIPTPNNAAKLGAGRDKYIVNPSAREPYHLELYEHLGRLMGCCIRTGVHFSLDFPSFFWKQLTCEEVTFEDLEEIDKPICDLCKFIEKCSQDTFEKSLYLNYNVTLSDKSIREIVPGGSKLEVKYEDRMDYVKKVLEVRIHESDLQMTAIRKGLNLVISEPLLYIVTWRDLELWVCGRAKVDLDLLKRHTKYMNGLTETSRRVLFLWEVLNNLKESEKVRFIKFCWGQERLPPNDEEFNRTQTRFMIKPYQGKGSQDKALPKADTCFFNLMLPDYSSKEILREKLLIAINTDCDSMNADAPIVLDPNLHGRGNHNGGGPPEYHPLDLS